MRRKPTVALVVSALMAMLLVSLLNLPLVSAFSGSGSGTPEDPYIITTVEQLQEMNDNLIAHYALGNNIDASDTVNWNDGAGFVPIGTQANYFTGSLDGRGCKISNLYINRSETDYVGLFGCVYVGSVVKNVGLENVNVSGERFVSGLIGYNYDGTVDNCYSTGIVSGSGNMGGLAGDSYLGTISNSYSMASVSGDYQVGGLVGFNDGIISNCYSTGSVNGTGGDVGGLVGSNFENVSNSFWDIETSGWETSDGGTGKTTENMKNVRTFTDNTWSTGLTTPWDFVGNPYYDTANDNIWGIYSTVNNGYPILTVFGVPPNKPTNLLPSVRQTTVNVTISCIITDNDGDQINAFFYDNSTKALIDNVWIASGGTAQRTWSGLTRGQTYVFFARGQDNNGYWGENSDTQSFLANSLPTATNLLTEGQTNPLYLTINTPTFSWTYSDGNGDNQSHYQVQVGTTPGGYDKWNPSEVASENKSAVYAGSSLSRGVTYYVRVQVRDGYEWSLGWATGTFKLNQLPTVTYSSQTFYMDESLTPTLTWYYSDSDDHTQLGVQIQVDNDEDFGSLLWDYSDNSTTTNYKTYAGDPLSKNTIYYARIKVRDGLEWSDWSENTFIIYSIPSLVVANIEASVSNVDRIVRWGGIGSVRIYATVKDNEGRDAIENVHFWVRDNNDAVVVDNAMHVGYENVNDNTKRLWYDYSPSDIMLDNALGEFDVKVQAVSANFENTKDYTSLGFKLFKVDDHVITFTPFKSIYVEGEIITLEPTVKSVATGLAVDNAYMKIELVSELGEALRTVSGYTNPSGKLATHTSLIEVDIGFYDVRISTSKGAIDGMGLFEDIFKVVVQLPVSAEGITPADDAVSGLLRSRSTVPEDVVVKVKVFDVNGMELLDLASGTLRVENVSPQLKNWTVSYGRTLPEGTYSYRVEVWTADLGTMYHVAFAEVRLSVAVSQQAVGEWVCVGTVETKGGTFDVELYRESLVTNPTTVDKSNFYFREVVDAPRGSTVLVSVSGLPTTTLTVNQYGMIEKYFDVKSNSTVKVDMEVTIVSAVKMEYLGESEVVAAVPKTLKEHQYRITSLVSTVLRELKLTFLVDGVVLVVDDEGRSLDFWEGKSTTVEIRELGSYGEITVTLSSELPPTIDKMIKKLITWTPWLGIPIVVFLLGGGLVLCLMSRKWAGPFTLLILLLLPTGLLMIGMYLGLV